MRYTASRMQVASLAVLLGVLVGARLADAMGCPHIEYAELTDMSQQELIAKYCFYNDLVNSNYDYAQKLLEVGVPEQTSGPLNDAMQCLTERERTYRMIQKKQRSSAKPSCPPIRQHTK